jgi:hypothetical protein
MHTRNQVPKLNGNPNCERKRDLEPTRAKKKHNVDIIQRGIAISDFLKRH